MHNLIRTYSNLGLLKNRYFLTRIWIFSPSCSSQPKFCSSTLSSAEEKEETSSKSTVSILRSSKFEKSETLPHWVRSPIDLEIFNADTPENLLALCEKYKLSHNQLVGILATLGKIGGQDFFQKNPELFQGAGGKAFERNLKQEFVGSHADYGGLEPPMIPVGEVVIGLRSLLYLGAEASDSVVSSLQHRLSSPTAIQRLNKDSLCDFTVFHSAYAESSPAAKMLQIKLENRLKKVLTNELIRPEKLLLLMTKMPYAGGLVVHTDWQKSLEHQATEICGQMSWSQCCRLINLLANMNSRNYFLLAWASQQLLVDSRQEGVELPLKTLVSLINAMKKINFFTPPLFEKISNDLLLALDSSWDSLKVQAVGNLLGYLGQMRVREEEVLEKLWKWMEEKVVRSEGMKLKDLIPAILAFAKCNFAPGDFVEKIKGKLSKKKLFKELDREAEEEKVKKNEIWLDVVWCMGILRGLTKELVKSVLEDRELCESLLDKSNPKSPRNKLKLMNLKAACELDLNVPLEKLKNCFSCDPPELERSTDGPYKPTEGDLLCAVINHIAPRETHSKMQLYSPEGYLINSEFVIGEGGRPLAIKDWDKVSEGDQSVWRKIAVVFWQFEDFTQNSQHQTQLIGENAMCVRHLQKKGYRIVQISLNEFQARRKFLQKLDYMKEKIAEQELSEIPSEK